MMRGSTPTTRIPLRGRSALLLLPLLSLTLAIWACGFDFSHIGAASLKVADVPIAQLSLKLRITNQFQDMQSVYVLALFFEGANAQQVAIPQDAKVTCNGTDITPLSRTTVQLARLCPRQQPGGIYRIAYSDTHGVATIVLVPVPAGGSFDIVSPAPGATVPIPTNGRLEIHYRAPTPPPNGSLMLDNVSASCNIYQQPCTLSAFPPFDGSLASSNGVGDVAALAQRAAVPTPTQAPTPKPGPTPKASPPPPPGLTPTPKPGNTSTPAPAPARGNAFASVSVRNGVGTILLRGDFSGFQAGPGTISLEAEGEEMLDHAGFADASATFLPAFIENTITWTH